MKSFCLFLCSFSILLTSLSAQQSLAERLGYDKGSKLLILHADDIGVSHSENAASILALEKGPVNSGSVMVPCPWFPEIAAYAKAHPHADLGLHLTLTSEWKYFRWGPVSSHNEVSSLIDEQGFFHADWEGVKVANLEEVEKEIRAQIERSFQFGMDPTHFDSHMFSLGLNPDLLQIYLKVSREYKVPLLMTKDLTQQFFGYSSEHLYTEEDVLVDQVYMALERGEHGLSDYYTQTLKGLQPGVSVMLLHAAFDNAEMQAVTVDHPDFGSAWRQEDLDYFTSQECRELLKKEGIQLITWREVRDKLMRK